jgi:DNA-binding transcriptional LysR family regulator
MAMELRHLRYFVAVAEEGHITRAAERLGMRQPPLSKQIQALERELSVQLFHRRSRGVKLTEAGVVLFEQSRTIFGQIDHALAMTRRTARGELGQISIGLTGAAIFHPLVQQIIHDFRKALPLISVALQDGNPFELLGQIERSEVDCAFVRTPVSERKGILVSPLLEEAMVVAMPSAWARGKEQGKSGHVALKDLRDEMFIDYGRPHGSWPWLRHAFHAACQAAGFSPRVGQHAPEMVSAVNLVAAGLGIAIVPASLRRINIIGISYLDLKGEQQPTAPLNFVSRRAERSTAVRRFLALVKSTTKTYRKTDLDR